ncbi:MAG: GIY-YIG nuclease family protein, partial [Gammaproteobacteria bacterium]|nr:GIY-YIG nuclease family protein [Gammaproteobacteria bacterium]
MSKDCRISIGALGERRFARGYYIYAGSAFAPGGLRARLRRHCTGGRRHWHIDYLRAHSDLLQIWWTGDTRTREHDWALELADWLGDSPVDGFGAGDSPLPSHLFFTGRTSRSSGGGCCAHTTGMRRCIARFSISHERGGVQFTCTLPAAGAQSASVCACKTRTVSSVSAC